MTEHWTEPTLTEIEARWEGLDTLIGVSVEGEDDGTIALTRRATGPFAWMDEKDQAYADALGYAPRDILRLVEMCRTLARENTVLRQPVADQPVAFMRTRRVESWLSDEQGVIGPVPLGAEITHLGGRECKPFTLPDAVWAVAAGDRVGLYALVDGRPGDLIREVEVVWVDEA